MKFGLKYFTLVILFSFTHFTSGAQDTTYYDKNGKEVKSPELAERYLVVTYNTESEIDAAERRYWMHGQIQSEIFFSDYKKKVRTELRTWKEAGNLHHEAFYKKGKLHGTLIAYRENGQIKRREFYKNGKLKESEVWDEEGNKVEYYPWELRPEFPGGQEAIYRYLQNYIGKYKNKTGRVVADFFLNTDGEVVEVSFAEADNDVLKEAVYKALMNMPRWSPAWYEGRKVRAKYRLPVNAK